MRDPPPSPSHSRYSGGLERCGWARQTEPVPENEPFDRTLIIAFKNGEATATDARIRIRNVNGE